MSDKRPLRGIYWTALALLVVAVGAFLIKGANTTQRPKIDANGATRSRVAGFDQIGFTVRSADGTTTHHCGLLALTTAEQDQGLMNRTNLAGYDGMLFQFVEPTTVEFYMKDTLIPLSIAWFDHTGMLVSTTNMPPCGAALVCPLYAAAAPYEVALEVPEGQLGHVGVGFGSVLTVGGSC